MALPRHLRLPGRCVRKVAEDGVRASAGPLLVRALARPADDAPADDAPAASGARLAIRVAGARRAVDRNAVRRRIADALSKAPADLPPMDLVLTWRLDGRRDPPTPAEVVGRWREAVGRLRESS